MGDDSVKMVYIKGKGLDLGAEPPGGGEWSGQARF